MSGRISSAFNIVSRQDGTPAAAFIERIVAVRPDLADQVFYRPAKGNCAVTLIVGDEVFKTPKNKRTTPEFIRELENLRIMRDCKTPFVPELLYVSPDKSFFSMKRMHGVTMHVFDGGALTEEEEAVLAADIGHARAMIELSLKDVDLPFSKKFNRPSIRDRNVMESVRQWHLPHYQSALSQMAPEQADILSAFVSRVSKKRRFFSHSDVHRGNIMVDPETKRLVGFVDMARAVKRPLCHGEFMNGMLHYVFSGRQQVKQAFSAYARKSETGAYDSDLFAYAMLDTMGFWLKDVGRKSQEVVDRCIFNCIEIAPRHRNLLP